MLLPKGATVAVADGEKLRLFTNSGDEGALKLTALPDADVDGDHSGSDTGHSSSAANPNDSQQAEDGFAIGIADILNKGAMSNKISHLVVIAAPRTLGELRKHYHKTLSAKLVAEISKDLTGHGIADIEKALNAD
jgi:protein required for attachment to host cells